MNTRTVTNNHTDTPTAAPSRRAQPMLDGRHADSARRRQRVLAALDRRTADGAQISVSAIARAAGVDRSFLYRHRDLLEKIHALAAEPRPRPASAPARRSPEPRYRPTCSPRTNAPPGSTAESSTPRTSALRRPRRARLARLRLGAPADIDALHHAGQPRLEQQVIEPGSASSPNATQGPRRRPRHQPRLHGPHQRLPPPPGEPPAIPLAHHTCCDRYRSRISF